MCCRCTNSRTRPARSVFPAALTANGAKVHDGPAQQTP